ncbi:MAG: hypothetical protein KKB63_01610, partial [Alphaproteobacteria bacterium]|nr:hypothetical protein [Alphaproteobacteria bacterium]
MYKDILLPIVTHPDTCSVQSIQASIEIASLLDAHLTALTTEPKFPLPLTFRPYAKEVKEGIAEIQKKIGETAARQFAYFEEEARRNGIAHETIMAPCPEMDIRSTILNYALLRNMTILPFIAEDSNWIGLAQSLIFESGHPVLILPNTPRRPFKLDRVVIGWDFTRA